MNNNNDLNKHDDFLKNIEVPVFYDSKHENQLKDKLLTQFQQKSFLPLTPGFKYALSLAALVLIIIFTGIYFYISRDFRYSKGQIVAISGNVYLKNKRQADYERITDQQFLHKNEKVRTDGKSEIKIKVGEHSTIKLKENSELEIVKLKNTNENENCYAKLEYGKVENNITLPNIESEFKILTDLAVFSVKGTLFSVVKIPEADVLLEVVEGIVEITGLINANELDFSQIEKYNEVYNKVTEILNFKIAINYNNTALLERDKIAGLNNNFVIIVNNINTKLKGEKLTDEVKSEIFAWIAQFKESIRINITVKKISSPQEIRKEVPEIKSEEKEPVSKAVDNQIQNQSGTSTRITNPDYTKYTGKTVKIKTKSGNIFQGKIISFSDQEIEFATTSVGTLKISKAEILYLEIEGE